MPLAILSSLDVNVQICPSLVKTTVSRYVYDVLFQLDHRGPDYTLEFTSDNGHNHCISLCTEAKAFVGECDVLLGYDWLQMCMEQSIPNPFPFTDLTSDGIAHIQALPNIFHEVGRGVASPRSRRCSQIIINEIFFRSRHSGVHTSIFHSTASELSTIMALHGLHPYGLDRRQSILMYLSHLVNGSCHEFRHNVPRTSGSNDRTACRVVSQDFDTSDHLHKYIVQILAVANSTMICTDNLLLVCESLGIKPYDHGHSQLRRRLQLSLTSLFHKPHVNVNHPAVSFEYFERYSKLDLLSIIDSHSICLNPAQRHIYHKDDLKNLILDHLSDGMCGSVLPPQHTPSDNDNLYKYIQVLEYLKHSLPPRPLKRLLQLRSIPYIDSPRITDLRRALGLHIRNLKKRSRIARKTRDNINQQRHENIQNEWPQKTTEQLKSKLTSLFREATSSDTLKSFTCACCCEDCPVSSQKNVNLSDIPVDLLRKEFSDIINTPELYGSNHDIMLLNSSIHHDDGKEPIVLLCSECASCLGRSKLPPLSMANGNYFGLTPDCLKDLTMVEEAMIARSRCKSWIVQLKEGPDSVSDSTAQRGIKGHVIVYPQPISDYSSIMPPSLADVAAPICVIFIGSHIPSHDWLRQRAKPLIVRREKIRNALQWLKIHNPLYHDITIDYKELERYPDEDLIPVHIEQVDGTDAINSLTANYDNLQSDDSQSNCTQLGENFERIVVSNVESLATTNELRSAAFRHFRERGNRAVQIPHGRKPVNEFHNPELFPRLYPTLFPYGIGGIEDENHFGNLSFKRNIRHLFCLHDKRFQEHYSFMFTAFNILQRRDVLLHTAAKVKKSNFSRAAETYSSVSPETIATVTDRLAKGDYITCHSPDERRVMDLMKDVNVVTSHVAGSSSSKVQMRNEIRGLSFQHGLPAFYLTINPADVYNPLVKFLAGNDINLDSLLPDDIPDYHSQSLLIARNPTIAAKFFNIIIKAFIECILGCDNDKLSADGGILGHVSAYYGCVEAQGRGTLHCHLVVWLEGAKNVDEIRKKVLSGDNDFANRLIDYLDDTISNDIPFKFTDLLSKSDDLNDTHNINPFENAALNSHPCATRGICLTTGQENLFDSITSRIDMRRLVEHCQSHKHTFTCYKYWKGPPEPRTCRFDLDQSKEQPITHFDPASGDLRMRCLNGLVNNFNMTILKNIRCNMDIKFIGSGLSAKAVLYYITDYITKSQLKAHVAFAALELAVRKLDEQLLTMDPVHPEARAKKLLQKCAFSMISKQELSAPQVMSYLLGYGDHYTNHTFRKFFWTSFERFVDNKCPLSDNTDDITGTCTDDNTENEGNSTTEADTEIDYDDNELEFEESTDMDSDEVIISDVHGNLIAHSTQISDYQLRGEKLCDLTLWDYFSSIEKITISKSESCVENSDTSDARVSDSDTENFLNSTTWKRPRVRFHPAHSEYTTHIQKVLNPYKRPINVPIGGSIPRRDRQCQLERYQRLMLIFFKPWVNPEDLLGNCRSWGESFRLFLTSCPDHFKKIMDNMQLMHECKDSRDDHFAQRLRERQAAKRARPEQSGEYSDTLSNENVTEDILNHIQDVDNCFSQRNLHSQISAQQCHDAAERGGVFSRQFNSNSALPQEEHLQTDYFNDSSSEDIWRNFYMVQNEQAKRASRIENQPDVNSSRDSAFGLSSIASDGAAPSNLVESKNDIHMDCNVYPDVKNTNYDCPHKHASHVASMYTLNREQRRAYDIITGHRLSREKDQLRMYIGGPGGTGKSRVIKALQHFFHERGEDRMLRLSSFTGIAANNIDGMTLHSALHLNGRNSKSATTSNNLIAAWQGIDYLFIDEISMVGCDLLARIDENLRRAKENDLLFGGINIIFAGDFAQLPPVGDTSLYAPVRKTGGKTTRSQRLIFGKLLWMSVDTVVMLTEIVRQSGTDNMAFQATLQRLRTGRCTRADFDLLNTRLLGNANVDWNSSEWDSAPIVVSDNETKDTLNLEASCAYARSRREPLNFYYAKHTRHGNCLADPELNDYLNNLSTGKTNQMMGALPLVSGMPVMLCHNYDVPAGVVNGSIGILKRINYELDSCGNRSATSCVVESQSVKYNGVNGLQPHEYVVFPEDTAITFRHPHTNMNCTIHRKQLPIVPAFAVTAHKSQGQTYPKVMLDLTQCRGSESPYVMLSRATALKNLVILRPFSIARIQSHQSEAGRIETRRLGLLRLQTIMKHGNSAETLEATDLLGSLRNGTWCDPICEIPDLDSSFHRCSDIYNDISHNRINDYSNILITGKRSASCLDDS